MKKFSKYIEEMSMSVTLKPKKNNMYKVTGVGKKMAAHGGIKKGEKFHDSEIDGMHDSGIKVKYEKPKAMKKESIQRRMDRMTIIATDPATGRKVVKVAPKKEIDIGKGKMESVVSEISDKMKVNYIKKANQDISDKEKIGLLLNKPSSTMKKDTMKRRAGVVMAKSKLGEAMDPIGKSGRHDIHHTDTSDYNYHSSHASNVSHGGKGSDEAGEDQFHYKFKDHKIDVNDNHVNTKLSHVQQRVKASGVSPKHQDAVSNHIHKHITQESVMKMYELKISTMQKYKSKAYSDVQDGENARHKGYPEKDIDKRQDKRYKGIDTANKRIAKKQVKMATGVAFDKRYKGGNMTGASKAIDKIKPGLSNHPKVKDALRRANEEFKGE